MTILITMMILTSNTPVPKSILSLDYTSSKGSDNFDDQDGDNTENPSHNDFSSSPGGDLDNDHQVNTQDFLNELGDLSEGRHDLPIHNKVNSSVVTNI